MAFTADCGSSTVLEALCVASTVGFLVPEESGYVGRVENSKFKIARGGWAAFLIPNS